MRADVGTASRENEKGDIEAFLRAGERLAAKWSDHERAESYVGHVRLARATGYRMTSLTSAGEEVT